MQDLLTLLFIIVGIGFVAIACYDFVTGFNSSQVTTTQKVATLEWLTSQIPTSPEPELEASPNVIVLAREKMKSRLDLSALKTYKLRGESVVAIADIPFALPDSIKRYKLREKYVVNLKHLEALSAC